MPLIKRTTLTTTAKKRKHRKAEPHEEGFQKNAGRRRLGKDPRGAEYVS